MEVTAMNNILSLIKARHSTRALFNPKKIVAKEDIRLLLEAARWAPTAHNMQNFEVIVVDDKKTLAALAKIESPPSEAFIRENYQQLSRSEEELKQKKVGILGTHFPAAWRDKTTLDKAVKEAKPSLLSYTIKDSPVILIVLYDARKRAPASEGDVLGFLSLGCVMQNMWLMAESLGIGFQIMSVFSNRAIAKELKATLTIPGHLEVAFAVRLGYPANPTNYLRVRRDVDDFTHHNRYGDKRA
jgi:nitroreductase